MILKNKFDDYILSFTTSLIPFIEHDDAIRCQMASNHLRQSINIKDNELPYIMTGFEDIKQFQKYNRINNNFYCLAKRDGIVIEKNDEHMIVHYDNNDFDIFKKKCSNTFIKSDRFKKGELLVCDKSVKNGFINNGINLLTGIMPYYGYNYQDAITVSSRLKDKLASYHDEEISIQISKDNIIVASPILFDNVKVINKGDSFLDIKKINKYNLSDLFGQSQTIISDKKYKINYINIYANYFNMYNRETEAKLLKFLKQKEKMKRELIIKNKEYVDEEMLKKYIYYSGLEIKKYIKRYKISNNKTFDGIMINIGVTYKKTLEIGDKIANRHGNKGIISLQQDDDKMLKTKDGRIFDIIINPLGIISRMNIGQIYELHAGYTVYNMRKKLNKLLEENKKEEIKENMLEYISTFDNTPNNWYTEQTKLQLKNENIDKKMIDNFYLLATPFTTNHIKLDNLMKLTNTPYEEEVYDPIDKTYKQIAVGYMYWFKLYHLVSEKTSARSIGKYKKKTHQPVKGRTQKGGQRFGEMEVWDLVAYDMEKNIKEFLSLKSDNFIEKYNFLNKIINEEPFELDKTTNSTETYNVFSNYMKALGLKIIK